MMGVMVVKTTQDNLPAVDLVVEVIIPQQHEIAPLRHVHPVGCELETKRQVQVIHKHLFLVSLAVVVGVLEDDQLVVRFCIARFEVRISWHRRHPETPPIVESQLRRIGQVRKFLFRREQLDPVTLSHLDASNHIVAVLVFELGVKAANLRHLVCGRVGLGQIVLPAIDHCPHGLIAIGHHLLNLLQFVRIVFRAVRIVPATKHMHAVGDLIKLLPVPVFLPHCLQNLPGLTGRARLAEQPLRKHRCKPPVSRLRQQRPIAGQQLTRLLHPPLGDREQVQKQDTMPLGHVLHRGGVK